MTSAICEGRRPRRGVWHRAGGGGSDGEASQAGGTEGQSLLKMAAHFGVATDTAALALRRAGVTLRPRRGWTRYVVSDSPGNDQVPLGTANEQLSRLRAIPGALGSDRCQSDGSGMLPEVLTGGLPGIKARIRRACG